MGGLHEKTLGLSPEEKRELLAELLRSKAARPNKVALSFAQERLWFLDQLEPGNVAYNMQWRRRVLGRLDVLVLHKTLNEIVRRHESLRTSFVAIAGEATQVISRDTEVELPVFDLRQVPEVVRKREVKRLAQEEAEWRFDLSAGPLFRASLIRLEEEDHILMLTMHHIVSDGWSVGLLDQELTELYEAYSKGQTSPLKELPIQYADFASWQRQWLQGEELKNQLSYWRQQLHGLPATLELPQARPRPTVRTYIGANRGFELPRSLTKALNELSRRQGATLFMTLLAAFQALLSRYTGETDICVGVPVANRNRAEIEELIGLFVNTLVMRTDLSGNPTFKELLSRVREVALGAYAHQDLPFEKLVDELRPERSISRNPFFDVIFALQNTPVAAVELSGLKMIQWGVENRRTKFDLEIHIWERVETLACTFVYNRDLFEAETIQRMLGHYEELLRGVVANPEWPMSQHELLRTEEREQLIVGWNRTASKYPRERCIQELFEEQVGRTPDSIAVAFANEEISYGELNQRANQLAHYLRKAGVQPEEMVGICVDRSVEMIVGLLGILKAGGVYVPLDPTYPTERLSFMLEDTQVPVLLMQASLRNNLPVTRNASVIALDTDWAVLAGESQENPTCRTDPENLAYVIYTSGSTGRPKGVSVPHRGVVRLVKETNYAKLESDEVFLQFAPLSFDLSTFEIWGSLLNGARLVMMKPGLPALAEVGETISRGGVTTLWLTAGLFHQMIESEPEGLRGLRQLLAGGDVLSVSHVEKTARELGSCRLINGYGPTENTTFTCCYDVKAGEQFDGNVPIGFPIANTSVYILDREMRLVPIGVAGELCTGGDGLARGYLNRPDLTAARFIPDSFSNRPGARLYRTGDLARYGPDGTILFLGRVDNQVKLRGFRIELGEIEIVLAQHQAVRECVVMVRKDQPEHKRLVAYIVPSQESASIGELRAFLKEKLPEYMVPSSYVLLEAVPLTANGKVDRRALLEMEPLPTEIQAAYVAPQTQTERTIVGIWQEVLHLEKVGTSDNFFDMGGHSLLVVKVHSKLSEVFGTDLKITDLFRYPTINSLARYLSEDQSEVTSFSQVHDRARTQKQVRRRRRHIMKARSE